MARRLFIAINLPEKIKDAISYEIEHRLRSFFPPGNRFVKPENWHITLAFLGSRRDDEIPTLVQQIKKVALSFPPPVIKLAGVIYGPPPRLHPKGRKIGKGGRRQSMIWLTGSKETNKNLEKIQKHFVASHQPFNTHITLLRFGNQPDFPRVLPAIERDVDWHFTAETLDLMESTLHHLGSQYTILFSSAFKSQQPVAE